MTYTMCEQHPKMREVMTLRDVDSRMRACDERLGLNKCVTRGQVNLTAIDICRCYGDLLEYVYLLKQMEIPGDKSISQIMADLMTEENESTSFKEYVLEYIPIVMAWERTPLPLPNIQTTVDEVCKVFERLTTFYRWVEVVYGPNASK